MAFGSTAFAELWFESVGTDGKLVACLCGGRFFRPLVAALTLGGCHARQVWYSCPVAPFPLRDGQNNTRVTMKDLTPVIFVFGARLGTNVRQSLLSIFTYVQISRRQREKVKCARE